MNVVETTLADFDMSKVTYDMAEYLMRGGFPEKMVAHDWHNDIKYVITVDQDELAFGRMVVMTHGISDSGNSSWNYDSGEGFRVFLDKKTSRFWKMTYSLSSWVDDGCMGEDFSWYEVFPSTKTVTVYMPRQ